MFPSLLLAMAAASLLLYGVVLVDRTRAATGGDCDLDVSPSAVEVGQNFWVSGNFGNAVIHQSRCLMTASRWRAQDPIRLRFGIGSRPSHRKLVSGLFGPFPLTPSAATLPSSKSCASCLIRQLQWLSFQSFR